MECSAAQNALRRHLLIYTTIIMKLHLNKVLTPVTALAVSWSFIACEKPAEKAAENPAKPAAEQPAKAADASKPAVEAVKNAVAAVVAPAANVANLREQYGFAARITNDVELLSETYRMGALWASVTNSKWAAKVVELVKSQPDGQRMLDQWNSPQAAKGKEYVGAFLGNEFFVVGSAGFGKKLAPWVELGNQFNMLYYQAAITGGMMGGSSADTSKAMERMFKDNADSLIPLATKLELPPILMGYKAGKVRAEFDGIIKQVLDGAPPTVDKGTFKVADKYDFQSLSVTVRKVIPQGQEEAIVGQLKELLGDEAAAKSAVAALMAKRFEVSWGWVEDYLVLSLGTDHAHVKLATGDADSALSIPEVAARAALFAGKNPIGLGYQSKSFFDSISTPMDLAKQFGEVTQSLKGIIAPDAILGMTADVKKLEAKVDAIMKTVNSSAVGVSYLEGGIRMDSLGGPRSANAVAAEPLTFSTLATPTTALAMVSRSNSASGPKTGDLIEDGAAMVWSWYEKYGKKMIPEDGKQGAAMAEAMGVPIVKDFWKSCRQLGAAFGDNSAILVDLNGPFPPAPGVPKVVLDGGKIPRLAITLELKDRASLSEAWKGFDKIIKQAIAFIPQGADAPPIPEPTMKKEGDVEIHYVELPVKLGDMLPHIAISKDKWILSTSTSYSAELAKLPAAGTTKQHGEFRADFGAVANFADHWFKLAASNPAEFFQSPGTTEEFQKNKALIESALGLIRAVKSAGIQTGEEGGKTHITGSLQVEDIK